MGISEDLASVGSILEGEHFVYQSGKHGPNYINIDPVLPEPVLLWDIGEQLLRPFIDQFDVIVAPATGGIPLGYAVGFQAMLRGRIDVKVVFCEKTVDEEDNKILIFDRATFAQHVKGKRVLVVDDIMTNPNDLGTVYKVCRLVEESGGTVIGVSLVCNRCGGTAEDLGVPVLHSLMEVEFEAFPREVCESDRLCHDHVPIVEDIGHGAEFKTDNPNYSGSYKKLLS